MKFTETKIAGLYVVEIERETDERGFFARIWDKREFLKIGLDSEFVQSSISLNEKKGTIRGMHYQIKPFEETKLVRCIRGSIFDVVIDLRPDSNTFKRWFSMELSEKNYKMLYIPNGCAHGFQTLEDNTEVFYEISQYFVKNSSRGILFSDPAFQINWPLTPTKISKKDLSNKKFEN